MRTIVVVNDMDCHQERVLVDVFGELIGVMGVSGPLQHVAELVAAVKPNVVLVNAPCGDADWTGMEVLGLMSSADTEVIAVAVSAKQRSKLSVYGFKQIVMCEIALLHVIRLMDAQLSAAVQP